jgi:hypothetical protein
MIIMVKWVEVLLDTSLGLLFVSIPNFGGLPIWTNVLGLAIRSGENDRTCPPRCPRRGIIPTRVEFDNFESAQKKSPDGTTVRRINYTEPTQTAPVYGVTTR